MNVRKSNDNKSKKSAASHCDMKPIGLDLLAIYLIRMLECSVKNVVVSSWASGTGCRHKCQKHNDLQDTALLDGHPMKYLSRRGLVQNLGGWWYKSISTSQFFGQNQIKWLNIVNTITWIRTWLNLISYSVSSRHHGATLPIFKWLAFALRATLLSHRAAINKTFCLGLGLVSKKNPSQ